MPRIKISMPDRIIFTVSMAVRITDINYGNHVGNDALVGLLHEARVMWLAKHDFTELDAGGAGLIMGDLAVEYMNQAFYGDMLTISIAPAEINRAGFELYYLVQTMRGGKDTFIARAKTGMICFDYITKKVIAIPAALQQILNN